MTNVKKVFIFSLVIIKQLNNKKMNDFINGLLCGIAGFCAFLIIPISLALWVVLAVAIDDVKQFLNNKIK